MSSRFRICLHPNSEVPDTGYGGAVESTVTTPPQDSDKSKLTTCVYHTDLGLFALTWTRLRLGRSLRLHLRLGHGGGGSAISPPLSSSSSAASFSLQIKPFLFWTKRGSKNLAGGETHGRKVTVFWDLTRAEFGSRPEPRSGYYIAVVVDGEMALLAGDSRKQAYAKTRSANGDRRSQTLLLRKESVFGSRIYSTNARIGGRNREIWIDCRSSEDPGLCFSIDRVRVLQIKRLKWKFRGNERIEVDGVPIQVSWDVYNWVFEDAIEAHAVFMFRFENQGTETEEGGEIGPKLNDKCTSGEFLWPQRFWGFGIDGIERENVIGKKKKNKGLLKTGRSSSSSSLCSASSSGSNCSVMEWASMEENELKGSTSGFSLLVYAWKS